MTEFQHISDWLNRFDWFRRRFALPKPPREQATRIAIVAGSLRDFEFYLFQHPELRADAVYISDERSFRGMKFKSIRVIQWPDWMTDETMAALRSTSGTCISAPRPGTAKDTNTDTTDDTTGDAKLAPAAATKVVPLEIKWIPADGFRFRFENGCAIHERIPKAALGDVAAGLPDDLADMWREKKPRTASDIADAYLMRPVEKDEEKLKNKNEELTEALTTLTQEVLV